MGAPIEDYALLGDCRSAALVNRESSIDWLCWPRFDSDACFAALLGNTEHCCWVISPASGGACAGRRQALEAARRARAQVRNNRDTGSGRLISGSLSALADAARNASAASLGVPHRMADFTEEGRLAPHIRLQARR
jgi:hypothetical protein